MLEKFKKFIASPWSWLVLSILNLSAGILNISCGSYMLGFFGILLAGWMGFEAYKRYQEQ